MSINRKAVILTIRVVADMPDTVEQRKVADGSDTV